MSNHIPQTLLIGGFSLFLLVSIVVIVRSRYQSFTNRYFVILFRNGKISRQEVGGGYFVIPLIDELVAIPLADQKINFTASQEIVFKPKFEKEELKKHVNSVVVDGFVIYSVEDPIHYFSKTSINDQNRSKNKKEEGNNLIHSTSTMLKEIIESGLKSEILLQPLDKIHRNHDILEDKINNLVDDYQERLGLKFTEIVIKEIKLNYTEF